VCIQNNIKYFRGNLIDLLDRHFKSALVLDAGIAVKIPSDCPLIDPSIIIDNLISISNQDKYDFVVISILPYPDGNDVEVMSVNQGLEQAESPMSVNTLPPHMDIPINSA
jgi:spore coat polysaccharide biosynthesis protein SpsF